MYLSKITLNNGPEIFDYLNKNRSNLYSDHQLIWSLFPGNNEDGREFLFRKDIKYHRSVYYVLSKTIPNSEYHFLNLDVKKFDPIINNGQIFSFNLRTNPVVAKKTEDSDKSKKHDVWMNAWIEGKKQGLKDADLIKFTEEKAMEWLVKRSVNFGFSIINGLLTVDNYRQHTFYKKKDSGGKVNISTLDYQGVLKVEDEDKFKKVISTGIGKSKSFGCGLMLLKRFRR